MILKFVCCVLAFVQVSWSTDIQRAKLVSSYRTQQVVFPHQQHYKQQNIARVPTTVYTKEVYYFSPPESENVLQIELNNVDLQRKYQPIRKTIYHRPEENFINYRDSKKAQPIQSSIIQKHGADNTFKTQSTWLPYVQQKYGSGNNIAHVKNHSLLPANTPVDKNYAMNFLPTGIDVVPGSSYIPLIKKL